MNHPKLEPDKDLLTQHRLYQYEQGPAPKKPIQNSDRLHDGPKRLDQPEKAAR